ncbi:mannitol dehydrogenase family protein [Leifsonia sp. NPDC080035]|uniref:Mannitol-1-phosphate 5-dehydrogenase n=1 Tax=Leifsonia sp. NPDC080035 TaxID=3143936 RepID=A0AAU7GFN4_9MICO
MTAHASPVPDRTGLTPGIAHIGVGNFHRSHQAMYLDRLLRQGGAREWGIVGVGLLPGDARMAEVLRAQDFTYTLVELAGDGSRTATSIGSIVDVVHAPTDPEAVLELLASPRIRIVSLTITEGGYNTSDVTGEFDTTDAAVRADVGADHPRTVFGVIAAGLHRRRRRGVPPFTVASCDNILGNGDTARRALVAFARLAYDDGFADWIDAEVAFPNSMVDRITPVTGDTERALVRETFGIDDAWPVVCEPFAQWVFEDRFPLGRPEWELVGAQPVDDVAPYELMKLRLLNGSHQAMAYLGLLRGHTYVHEAMGDPAVTDLIDRWMDEAAATLPPVAGVDIPAYRAQLRERFANPYIRDTLERLATDASDRIPKFVLGAARERAHSGLPSPAAATIAATWAALLASGRQLPDRQAERISAAVADAATAPERFLDQPDWFGELADEPEFVAAFVRAYRECRG